MSKPALLCCSAFSAAIAAEDGQLVKIVQLIPMGTSKTRNGKPASITLEDMSHAQQVVEATTSYHSGADVVVDFDHQTVRAPAVAGTAPAAGWMKRIFATDQGIMAEVEWTEEASAMLRDRKYRAISPYFAHTADGRVTRIINAGLTNTPNLDLLAVASAISTEEEEDPMDLKAIASALGLAEDADAKAIAAAAKAAKDKADQFDATASALGVEVKDGELTAVASAATALKDAKPGDPDPAKFVPVSKLNEVLTEMSALKTSVATIQSDKRAGLIDAAVKEGRLPPALKSHAESIADETALCSFLDGLPKGFGKVEAPKREAGDTTTITAEEKSIASMMGLSDADYLKTRNEMEAV